MGIARYEDVGVYDLLFGLSNFGETQTSQTLKFTSRPKVHQVKNSLLISERYRVYSGLINFTFSYTPYTRDMADNQDKYSVKWRGEDYRIDSATESDDRMHITFLCYHNKPATNV